MGRKVHLLVIAPALLFATAMTQADVLQVFRDSGALLEGHFLLRSGMHSRQFFQCALALRSGCCGTTDRRAGSNSPGLRAVGSLAWKNSAKKSGGSGVAWGFAMKNVAEMAEVAEMTPRRE